jgi:hypothetical protein
MADQSLFSMPVLSLKSRAAATLLFVFLMITAEWFNRNKDHALADIGQNWSKSTRWISYYFFIFLIFFFAALGQNFIYVQF